MRARAAADLLIEALVDHDVELGDVALGNGTLPNVVQRVTIYGEPRADGSNVVLAPHALTGSSRVAEWWRGLVGPGALLDPEQWCIIGVNVLGGCYGSTGPASLAPDGRRWGPRFPVITVEEMVDLQRRALLHLGIDRLAFIIGGSLGGSQALAWVRRHGAAVDHAIVLGSYDHLRAQAIAQNGLARAAIAIDPAFRDGWYDEPPAAGLGLARGIATLTYKSEALFEDRFTNRPDRGGGDPARVLDDRFDVDGYLAYQGKRFAERLDANTYRTLTRAMDLFDLRAQVAPPGPTRLTFVGITGDQLYPPEHVRETADRWAAAGWDATFRLFTSHHGHDAFLAEPGRLGIFLADLF